MGAASGTSPDLDRLGGLGWARRTGGRLTRAERRRVLAAVAVGQGEMVVDRLRLLTGRVPAAARSLSLDALLPPDSPLARAAEDACAEQSREIAGHSMRTWAFGRTLALLDGAEDALDLEAFYVAALVHDHGLEAPVAGQDFAVRSAERAARCVHDTGGDDTLATAIGDAICVHSLPGANAARDGALGTYVQGGAVLDLLGIGAGRLTPAFRDEVCARWDRSGVTAAINALIRAEARANPGGRFALLNRCGFSLLTHVAPLHPH